MFYFCLQLLECFGCKLDEFCNTITLIIGLLYSCTNTLLASRLAWLSLQHHCCTCGVMHLYKSTDKSFVYCFYVSLDRCRSSLMFTEWCDIVNFKSLF